jgi:hypothetical protein
MLKINWNIFYFFIIQLVYFLHILEFIFIINLIKNFKKYKEVN